MRNTTNYSLLLPDEADFYDVGDMNSNMENIDAQMKRIEEQANNGGDALKNHTDNVSNPHGVTKAQIGLGNVDNTSDANKPISTAVQTALSAKLDATGNAVSASKLQTRRKITLAGSITGNAYFDGTSDITIYNTFGIPNLIEDTGEDLDDYVNAGIWSFPRDYTPSNAPSASGWLVVIQWGDGLFDSCQHIWFDLQDGDVFVRRRVGGEWGMWKEVELLE